MTKNELKNLIDSFGKNPGEYTREEYYQIGQAHKELSQQDKSWEALTHTVGWIGTPESYRAFVNRQEKALRASKNVAAKTPVNSNYEEEFRRLYIEKQKIRDIRNDYNKQLRYEARLEDLRDTMIEIAEAMPPLPLINYKKETPANLEKSAILCLGDWHIGQEANNFYNKYNPEIAKERLQTVIKKAIRYCKNENVKVLHVLNLGDLIEGFINLDARIAQTRDVVEQTILAEEYMTEALCELQEAAPVVTYRSCIDNHARFHQDKKQAIPTENFNRLIDHYVQVRLKNSNIKFMEDNIAPNFGRFTLENGMKIAFAHGHEPKDKKEHTLQTMVGALREWTDVVIYGHTHNPAEHVYQNMRVFYNGSLCGVGSYPMGLGLFTEPSQKLLIFSDKDFLDLDLGAN